MNYGHQPGRWHHEPHRRQRADAQHLRRSLSRSDHEGADRVTEATGRERRIKPRGPAESQCPVPDDLGGIALVLQLAPRY